MNPTYRLAIPIGLGLLAAGTNFVLISQATKTVEIVAVVKDVPAGERLAPDCLGTVRVRADKGLFDAVVQGKDIATLHRQSIGRPLKKGDLVFRADVVDPESLMSGMNLKPGEAPRQVIVPYAALVPGLRAGDPMLLTFRTGGGGRKPDAPELAGGQLTGLRFLGAVSYSHGSRAREQQWQVVFAARADDPMVKAFFENFTNPGDNVLSISKYVSDKSPSVARLTP